jgi:hypothetical protein
MFKINCKNCDHSKELEKVGACNLDFRNISSFYPRFYCGQCQSKKIDVYANEQPVFQNERLSLCGCGQLIPIPRINNGYTNCIACQENEENPGPAPFMNIPSIPENLRSCPRGHPSVIQMNNEDGSFFIGCSEFSNPRVRCMWRKSI